MPKPKDIATSYEQITDNTVPELDLYPLPSLPTLVPDSELENRVRESLRTDARLAKAPIDVRVVNSHVWLTGSAIGPGTAAYAGDVAKRVEGVIDVHNEISISQDQ